MSITSLYPVTMSTDPQRTAAFYRELLDLEPTFSSDWYVSLAAPGGDPQFATVLRDHETVPAGHRAAPAGTLVTVEVDEVDPVWERAQAMEARVELELRDEPWGGRHFIVRDPDGALVDVIQPIPPTAEFAASYTDAARP